MECQSRHATVRRSFDRLVAVAVVTVLACGVTEPASAALSWNPGNTFPTATGTSGTWSTSVAVWSTGTSPNVAWNNASPDQANFPQTSSTPCPLTLGSDVTAASFNANVSAQVTVSNSGSNTYAVTLVGTAGSQDVTLGNASSAVTINAPLIFSTVNRTDFRTGPSITSFLGGVAAQNAVGNPTPITLRINATTTLGGPGSYSGTTEISGSARSLILASDSAMGSSVLSTYSSSSANFLSASGGPRTIGNDLLLANISASKNLTMQGSFDMTFNGTVRLTQAEGNINDFLNVNGITVTFNGNVLENTANVYTFNKGGSGTLVLNGAASAWRGVTAVSAGTLAFKSIADWGAANVSALGSPSTAANGIIAVGATATGATLKYTGAGNTSNRVIDLAGTTGGATLDQSGAGLLKFTSAFTASGSGAKVLALQGSTAGTGEIAGAIVDSAGGATSVTKGGTGTWTLSGNNSYSGGTTVSAGRLWVSNTAGSGTGTGAVSVTGGALGGTGTISGPVAVQSGGAVAPGSSIGTLSITSGVTFVSGSFFDVEFNGASMDRLNVTGAVDLGGATLRLYDLGTQIAAPATFTILSAGSPIIGTFAGYPQGSWLTYNGFVGQLSYTGNQVQLLNFVPEPTTLALLALAGGVLARRRRR